MFIYNVKTFYWEKITPPPYIVDKRRNHTAVLIGKYILIHGGILESGDFAHDTWVFNIETKDWKAGKFYSQSKHDPYKEVGIAFHAA